jgi:hypothetical protein
LQDNIQAVTCSKNWISIEQKTLETILSQEYLNNITELKLFSESVRWAQARADSPSAARKELGTALGLLRFRSLSAKEFGEYVCVVGLLTPAEESAIFRCITGSGNMPPGFSSESKPRSKHVLQKAYPTNTTTSRVNLYPLNRNNSNMSSLSLPQIPNRNIDSDQRTISSEDSFEEPEYYEVPMQNSGQVTDLSSSVFQLPSTGHVSVQSANAMSYTPLQFSTNFNAILEGIVIKADRSSTVGTYDESLNVVVKGHLGTKKANISFNSQVTSGQLYKIDFKPPCTTKAGKLYSITLQYNNLKDLYLCGNIVPGSIVNGSLEVKIERDVKTQIQTIYFSEQSNLDRKVPTPKKSISLTGRFKSSSLKNFNISS